MRKSADALDSRYYFLADAGNLNKKSLELQDIYLRLANNYVPK